MAELTDEAKAEIAAAVKILREDGIHVHKTYKHFLSAITEDDPDNPSEAGKDQDGKPLPPPAKDKDKPAGNPALNTPPAKKGLWWGDRD